MNLDERLDSIDEMFRGHEFENIVDTINEMVSLYDHPQEIHPEWFVTRGLSEYLISRFSAAVASYETALKIDPDYVGAHINLAYILSCCPDAEFHDVEKAISLGQRCCELTRFHNWSSFQVLAGAHARAGNFTEATNAVEQAFGLVPSDLRWRVSLLQNLIVHRMPYTASIEDDLRKMDCKSDRT